MQENMCTTGATRRARLDATHGHAAARVAGSALRTMAQDAKPGKIGWYGWAEAEFVTKLAAKLITDKLGGKVDLVQTDVAPLYQGVSRGDVDFIMMNWMPALHADFFDKVQNRVEPLGTVYDGSEQLGSESRRVVA